MIHFTCNRCRETLRTVYGAHVINAERIDFCEPCDRAFREWLKAGAPAAPAVPATSESLPKRAKP